MPVIVDVLLLIALVFVARRLGIGFSGPNADQRKLLDEEKQQRDQEYDRYRQSQQQPWEPTPTSHSLEEDAAHAQQRSDQYHQEQGQWVAQQSNDWGQRQQFEIVQTHRLHADLLANERDGEARRLEDQLAAERERRRGDLDADLRNAEGYDREQRDRYEAERSSSSYQPQPYQPEPYQPYQPEPYQPYQPEPYSNSPAPEPYVNPSQYDTNRFDDSSKYDRF